MNNKPVAWMSVELNGRTVLATYEFETAIPLYTHPVKELTDEEITDCKKQAQKEFELMITPQSIEIQLQILDRLFARAILRKAQEK